MPSIRVRDSWRDSKVIDERVFQQRSYYYTYVIGIIDIRSMENLFFTPIMKKYDSELKPSWVLLPQDPHAEK
jgi:hypothetical protein